MYLSKIIANEKYSSEHYTDLEIVDSLYVEAIKFYEGDISEALLSLTFATLPFNKMPISLPILDVIIPLHLPSVQGELFITKRQHLPGMVYFDSKFKGGQDKDKVAHFFGNAFLTYNISIFNASKFLGLLVEMFESEFKVSHGIDFRDLQTNHLGELFGKSLKENKHIKPSNFFNVYSLFYFSYN
ncbi:hypothetical protein KY321_00915 [Candidatus Woesearchaeota archaeon]|nr:hypothetical protein [Candidatus Woesearchaeota archaeon]